MDASVKSGAHAYDRVSACIFALGSGILSPRRHYINGVAFLVLVDWFKTIIIKDRVRVITSR